MTEQPDDDFGLGAARLRVALDDLAGQDDDIAAALEAHGHPPERRSDGGFPVLLRIIIGQQLSVKAAATIAGRLERALDGTVAPERFLALGEEELRALGLSRQKILYGRDLSERVLSGALDPHGLGQLDDAAAIAALTAVKGLGVWSAQMYLMFSLGRPDIWPAGDLGVREGLRRIRGLPARPGIGEMAALGQPFAPRRSCVALLCWHVLHNSPA